MEWSASNRPCTVLVVGAGPTGLALALELARAGVRVRIVDRAPGPSDSSRALGVHARTLELLDLHGLGDSAVRSGQAIGIINIYAGGDWAGRVHHAATPSRYACALALSQAHTERLMREQLARLGTYVEWDTELDELGDRSPWVIADVVHGGNRRETIKARWMVGCDGAHSAVRRLLALDFEGESSDEGWAVMDAELEWELAADEGHIFNVAGSYTLVLPQRDGIHRIMLSGRSPARAASMPTTDELEGYLHERCGVPARLTRPRWTSRFAVQRRQAARYRHGHVLLAGDAAHVHSPSGGQGLNTGIQDAFNLGWKLALVVRGRADGALLDSYEAERKPVARDVLRLTDEFQRRTAVLACVPQAELRMSGVALAYRDSALSVEANGAGAVRAGDRLVDAPIHHRGATRLYELLRRRRPLAAVRDPDVARRLAVASPDLDVWVPREDDDEACAALELDGGCTVVRPDAYVGLRTGNDVIGDVRYYLSSALRLTNDAS